MKKRIEEPKMIGASSCLSDLVSPGTTYATIS